MQSQLVSRISLILSVVLAFTAGGIVTAYRQNPRPPLRIVEDTSGAEVAIVTIEGIRNGALVGDIQGNVRLVAGTKTIVPNGSGSFAIRDTAVLVNEIHIVVPPGMQFVASTRGKKYYPVTSASGQQIVPENRIYFPDAQSAERAGYSR